MNNVLSVLVSCSDKESDIERNLFCYFIKLPDFHSTTIITFA